ncbi:MAG: hypothetical protein H6626_05435 [Pseudobdellovibrionaceae bacterium]|nr:hypothetical protein [Bdellovibrionales bacterium]USN48536.1 MAG: hypothetical protein H6626_05435 [Pseudobdellovibrionaceae bacterium]
MKTTNQRENPFINLLFNIVLPVALLNQLTKRLGEDGPLIALLVALAFPIGYGAYDYLTRHKKNYISLLGVINVLFTGGLALMSLEGIWFAVKEAAFPLILGIGVYLSAYTRRPFMRFMVTNENVMNFDLVTARLEEKNHQPQFDQHIRTSTKLLATSFFLSSLLNFFLARSIFVDIDPALSTLERSTVLNEQIADMTWRSFIVIVLPLMVFMAFVGWHLISGIKKLTDLEIDDIMPHVAEKKPTA